MKRSRDLANEDIAQSKKVRAMVSEDKGQLISQRTANTHLLLDWLKVHRYSPESRDQLIHKTYGLQLYDRILHDLQNHITLKHLQQKTLQQILTREIDENILNSSSSFLKRILQYAQYDGETLTYIYEGTGIINKCLNKLSVIPYTIFEEFTEEICEGGLQICYFGLHILRYMVYKRFSSLDLAIDDRVHETISHIIGTYCSEQAIATGEYKYLDLSTYSALRKKAYYNSKYCDVKRQLVCKDFLFSDNPNSGFFAELPTEISKKILDHYQELTSNKFYTQKIYQGMQF